jgi:hypothetical protein
LLLLLPRPLPPPLLLSPSPLLDPSVLWWCVSPSMITCSLAAVCLDGFFMLLVLGVIGRAMLLGFLDCLRKDEDDDAAGDAASVVAVPAVEVDLASAWRGVGVWE